MNVCVLLICLYTLKEKINFRMTPKRAGPRVGLGREFLEVDPLRLTVVVHLTHWKANNSAH